MHAPIHQRLQFCALSVLCGIALYWRDDNAEWRSDLLDPRKSFSYEQWHTGPGEDGSVRKHTLIGLLLDYVAEGEYERKRVCPSLHTLRLQQNIHPPIASAIEEGAKWFILLVVYQYFQVQEKGGNQILEAIKLTETMDLVTAKIESVLGAPSEPLPPDLGRGSSEDRRHQRQSFLDALERIAPEEHARNEKRVSQVTGRAATFKYPFIIEPFVQVATTPIHLVYIFLRSDHSNVTDLRSTTSFPLAVGSGGHHGRAPRRSRIGSATLSCRDCTPSWGRQY